MTAITKTSLCLSLASMATLAFLAGPANAQQSPEITYEFSVIPGEGGQPDFGRPFHAAASPDGRHLYVDTFPPGPALLTLERDEQTLVLRDSLDLLEAEIGSSTDLKVTEDGQYVLLAEFSPAALHVFERNAESGLLTRVQVLDPDLDIVLDGLDVEEPGLVWGRRQAPEEGSVLIPLVRTAGAARDVSSGKAVVPRQGEMPFELGEAIDFLTTGVRLAERQEWPRDPNIGRDFDAMVVIDQERLSVHQEEHHGTVDEILLADLGIGPFDIARAVVQLNAIKIFTRDGRVIFVPWFFPGQVYPPGTPPRSGGFEVAWVDDLADVVTELSWATDVETLLRTTFGSVGISQQLYEIDIIHAVAQGGNEELVGVMVETSEQEQQAAEGLAARLAMQDLEVSTFPIAVPEEVPLGRMQLIATPDGESIYGAQTNPPAIHVLRYQRGDVPFCVPSDHTACPSSFSATVDWQDPQGATGQATVVPGGTTDSSLFWFFSEDNWEMLLKVLDGCGMNGHWWVFFAATTNVGFDVEVSDPDLGSASYSNPVGVLAPAVTDTTAIPCSDEQVAAAEARFANDPAGAMAELDAALGELDAWARENRSNLATRPLEPAGLGDDLAATRSLAARQGCEDTATALCLNHRFLVEVAWRDFEGATGSGTVAPLRSADSGVFWFFLASNWELLVKVLDGCGFNDRYWVLGAATTNVEYTLTITDTETGAVWTHTNPLGLSSPAVADLEAFTGCP